MKTQTVFKLPEKLVNSLHEADRLLAGGNCDLALDFADCQWVTVEGLEWLEELLLRAASNSSQVSLTNVTPSIYKVFKVARIDSIMKACGSPAASGPVC